MYAGSVVVAACVKNELGEIEGMLTPREVIGVDAIPICSACVCFSRSRFDTAVRRAVLPGIPLGLEMRERMSMGA